MIDAEHKLFQQQLKSAENQILELMRGTQGAGPSDAMVSSYEKVQALNNDLTRQIEELRAQKESLTAENDDLKDKNSELQADLSAKDTYTENTRAELDKIKGITKKLTHELTIRQIDTHFFKWEKQVNRFDDQFWNIAMIMQRSIQ